MPPAKGEEAAVAGFHYQYAVGAALVLRGLADGSLGWVRLKAVEAGRVDDLVLGRAGAVHGYQAKHRATAFSFRMLAGEDGEGGPPLIRQLADGWALLRQAHRSRVVVHLVTNSRPSSHDKVGDAPVPRGTRRSFARFLAEAWALARQPNSGGGSAIPPDWTEGWRTLCDASGLDAAGFEAFIRDCELEFGVGPLGPLGAAATRDQTQARADVDHIRHALFDAAARRPAPIHLDRAELLALLSWTRRFLPSNPHVFPVDQVLYQPIRASVDELDATLTVTSGGYVGVFGSPGSGKSTLLTQALRFRPERVVRYYAHVPDPAAPGVGRGEADNFLHDLVLALHVEGFRAGEGTVGFDRLVLLERLRAQLRLLHEDWVGTGRKTLILVDGLDHATRAPLPDRPFLRDLPPPEQVPEGVVFVLGSQTDAPLPPRIRRALGDAGRRVEIRPLSREEVLGVAARVALPVGLSDEQRAQIVERSAGHPLALVYLLNALGQAAGPAEAQAVLDGTAPFAGDIAARYDDAWAQVEDDHVAVQALGYAARLRGPVDLGWLERWLGLAPARAVRRGFGHFFRHEEEGRSYFFHESFRRFLLKRSAETWPGRFDPARDAALHRDLADRCAQEPAGSRWSWEELYHRAQAGQDEQVLARATQGHFRAQALSLRPIPAIATDVGVTLRSAARQQDPVALVRMVLAGAELGQRSWHLEQVPLARLLVDLGEPLRAAEQLREGYRLLTPALDTLKACPLLADAGLTTEAALLFDLAEPLHLLGARRPLEVDPHHETRPLLAAWAEVAPRYRPVDRIVRLARRLSVLPTSRLEQDPEEASRALQDELILRAGMGLVALRRWDDVARIADHLDPADGSEPRWWFWLHARAWQAAAAGDAATAERHFTRVLERYAPRDLGPEERVAVAEAAFRIRRDEGLARAWLDGLPQPEFDPLAFGLDAGFDPFEQRFGLNRLRYALGEPLPPADLVPLPADSSRQGVPRFERFVCVVARLEGLAWRGQALAPPALVAEVEPYLYLFDRRLDHRTMGTSWYTAERARPELVARLVRATSRHGAQAVQHLRAALERGWGMAPWANEDRRAAIVALARAGESRPWAVGALRNLEPGPLPNGLTFERIKGCQDQAGAWLALDEEGAARETLARLLIEANAVAFRKDHQLASWIGQWLAPANAAEPEAAAARVAWLARATLVLDQTTEDGAERSAAEALLGAAFRWSPRRAVALLRWCLAERLVELDDALAAMLLAALDAPPAPLRLVADVLTEMVLPIAWSGPSPALLRRLVAAVADAEGPDAAVDLVRSVADRVATYALPSARDDWRRFLREALERHGLEPARAGLARPDPAAGGVEEHPTPLRLRDGSALSVDEVGARADSVAGLRGLLDRQAEDSYFDWLPTVERLARMSNNAQLLNLAEAIEERHGESRVLSFLGEQLALRQDREGARTVALKRLDATEPWGWDRRVAGGAKIDAARRLVGIDRSWAVPRVYDRLVADLSAEPSLWGTVARNLGGILPLLADPVPAAAAWAEVEDFVRALFAAHALPDANLGFLDAPPGQDTAAQALGDIVAMHLRHPTWALSQGAQQVCAEGVLCGDAALVEAARDALAGPEDLQEATMEVLEAVALHDPSAIRPLRDDVVRLAGSPNFAVRSIAVAICDRVRWPHPGVLRPRPRPAAYDLVVPRGPRLDLSPAAARAVAATSGDPRLLLRPFDATLRLVAEVAGLPVASVIQRAAGLMPEIADPGTWSREAGLRLGGDLRAAGLYLTFRAPRPMAARQALLRVVAELVDAGDIDARGIALLAPWLAIHDPAMVLREPAPRPALAAPMAEPAPYGAWEAWLGRADESCGTLTARREPDRTVLAERTRLEYLSHEEPSEERSVTAVRGAVVPLPSYERGAGVVQVVGCPIDSYPGLVIDTEPVPLVIGNVEFGARDTPASDWLALNPTVGRALGWTLDPAGLFRWVDADGRAMVESVWWLDGVPGTHWSGSGQGEVGEGWLVSARPAAVDALRDRYGLLSYWIEATRRLGAEEGGRRRERSCVRRVGW